jgi:hypothetical protein
MPTRRRRKIAPPIRYATCSQCGKTFDASLGFLCTKCWAKLCDICAQIHSHSEDS